MPMSFCFEIPSKTFVIGEYLALEGTASMLLATKPCFIVKTKSVSPHLENSEDSDRLFTEFHPDSPAGKLCRQLKQKETYFIEDPHENGGGFGRSTAEYLSVFIHDLILKKKSFNSTENSRTVSPVEETKTPEIEFYRGKQEVNEFILNNLRSFIATYQSCVSNYKPSGADLVAQVCGGLCWYDGMNFSCEQLGWPFPGYDICIFKTGYKQKTHKHLRDIKNKNLKLLIPTLISARLSLEQANLRMFCQSINDYYDILGGLGLSDPKVQARVHRLREQPEVLAAKACGAMGMDTVLIISRLSDENKVRKFAEEQGFSLVSQLKQSHPGVCYSLY